ncbi:TRAP transporter large permease [Moorella sulfitireducens]|uniref:TRAP transporter large permease n=1 Tax=Neomoorella sulfitireducens TaxID=2972948 RepID=UPI0021ABC01A|nr:TRAP transporter large permease [Moorella sulfitireducens]
MEITTIGLLGIIVLLLLMLTRMPIGFIMALVGFVGVMLVNSLPAAMGVLKTVPYSTVSSYNLSVIPLFILMGEFASRCGLTEGLYNAVYKVIGHLKGGLAMATILACGLFGAICGSSPATAGALGKVALPEMDKYKYDSSFAGASVVAGGSLGSFIPPGVPIVLYAILTEQSIGKMIIACVIPGAVLMLMYMITAYLIASRYPQLAPPGPRHSLADMWHAVRGMLPIAIIFVITMGGIYVGIFTATEAAAVGTFLTFLYAVGTRQLSWEKFVYSLLETGKTSAMIFTILIGAMIFGYFMSLAKLPMVIANFISGLEVSRYLIIVGIMIVYLILGCFMDSLAMLLLTVPIFFPVIQNIGFDPIWFGVLAVTCVEEGLITPPVGMNLYVVKGISEKIKLEGLFRRVLPYVLTIVVFQLVLFIFPQLATWLPSLMKF